MKQELSFYLLTDPHYFSPQLGNEGRAYELREQEDQVCLKESPAIIDAAFDMILQDKAIDLVLIPGDLINCGEKICHEEFIQRLHRLRQGGKRVIVTTATHDYMGAGIDENVFIAKRFEGHRVIPVPHVEREELRELYAPFGRGQALSVHEPSMSYCVQLAPGYRLLALNDDGNGRSFCGYAPDCMEWIMGEIEAAKREGEFVFAMTHHPLIPPIPVYPMLSERDMLGNYKEVTRRFADAGLQFVFTGHTHMHNINKTLTARGNTLYDIGTAALVGAGGCLRKVHMTSQEVQVETIPILEVPGWDMEGLTFPDYFRKHHFTAVYREFIHSAAHDRKHLAYMLDRPYSDIRKYAFLLLPGGRFAEGLTFGRLARWGKCRSKLKKADWAAVKDKKVLDAVMEIIEHIFSGDGPYPPASLEYKIIMGFADVLDTIFKVFGIRLDRWLKDAVTVRDLLDPMLYNNRLGSDLNAVLPVRPFQKED